MRGKKVVVLVIDSQVIKVFTGRAGQFDDCNLLQGRRVWRKGLRNKPEDDKEALPNHAVTPFKVRARPSPRAPGGQSGSTSERKRLPSSEREPCLQFQSPIVCTLGEDSPTDATVGLIGSAEQR